MVILNDQHIEVHHPQAIASVLQKWFAMLDEIDRQKEHFFIILLDTRQKVKLIDVVSVGTLNAAIVHPREVFVRAIVNSVASMLIAHNHPNGACEPSEEDISISRKLCACGRIMGIEVIDHITFSEKEYYSFKEHGLL
jgi:DNA repair protein RadC